MKSSLPPKCLASAAFAAVLVSSSQIGAVTFGQVDDFQDGTTQNWLIGSVVDPPPLAVMGDGRDGAGDLFLQFSPTGVADSPAGKLTMFNRIPNQWSGDYLAEGITSIRMDILNAGNAPLHLRLAFNNLIGESGTWFVSEEALLFGPGPDWVTVDFPIGSDDLTSVFGTDDYDTVMSNVRSVRFVSSMDPAFKGDVVMTTIGLDDITALPEPSTAVLIGLGGLVLLRRRR